MENFRDRRPDALGCLRVLPDELICSILEWLTPRDVSRLACVSSVLYILCNEEPLWMRLCLSRVKDPLQYKGSWKKTTLHLKHLPNEYIDPCTRPLHFDGFNSLFLYKRFYRRHATLHGFYIDSGNVERRKDISQEEFYNKYDAKKPVVLTGLADTWPARRTWTTDQILLKHGDTAFKISQRSSHKISMKFKDYVLYMEIQHDEDPLYIFDNKFGEVAPDLLEDYKVPRLFQDDYFDVLESDKRPPYRWLIIGPERSGASWHVDPALTSAWNTLLCGRKRWALYPPGKVPFGVTVHVNEVDGDVDIDTPTSLQWWMDYYPLLADEDKPIECTQLPGETIYVPSGWWHCVLNLETTIAVTQNFVNSNNFEFVCLDMAPGYQHKGACRAGFLALDVEDLEDTECTVSDEKDSLSNLDHTREDERSRIQNSEASPSYGITENGVSKGYNLWNREFFYDIKFLATFLDEERDHYNSPWSSGNCIGQRELREWLYKLWIQKPGMRELTWKGACLALNANRWLECLTQICAFHNLPSPTDDERLPVGMGSNPVYLLDDCVIKIFVEESPEDSVYCLGTELEFYSLLCKVDSPLKNHVPDILISGIIYLENGSYTIVPWDGKGVPDVIAKCNMIPENVKMGSFPFGIWSRKQFEYRKAAFSSSKPMGSAGPSNIWPYIISKRCKGKTFAQLREILPCEDTLNLASFLGEHLRNLHLLPHPHLNDSIYSDFNTSVESFPNASNFLPEWNVFIATLTRMIKNASGNLRKWGDAIPSTLIEKVNEYLPDDPTKFLNASEVENGLNESCKGYSWIHTDIMDDNIHMEPCSAESCTNGDGEVCSRHTCDSLSNAYNDSEGKRSWFPNHILDFSNLSIGDPICDLIPIHLDVFRGDSNLLKHFLESYKLPLVRRASRRDSGRDDKFQRPSYRAMCYCILHKDNVFPAIFSLWKDLRTANSWEEIEHKVWGELDNYTI